MKELKDDRKIKEMLKAGLLENAPVGMVDRIMSTIAVSPARRLATKPVEPNLHIATIILLITGVLVAIAIFFKTESSFTFNLDQYFSLNINPIWVAPMLVISLTVWGYILLTKRQTI